MVIEALLEAYIQKGILFKNSDAKSSNMRPSKEQSVNRMRSLKLFEPLKAAVLSANLGKTEG